MQEQTLTLDDYVAIVKRRKWQMIVPAIVLFVLAAIAAVAIPPTFRSSATILIEQQEIPNDLVRSTVTTFADQRVQTISQRVMTTANLGKIIDEYKLYPDLMERYGLASAVDQMRKDVKLEMISADVVDPRSGRPMAATIAFSLSYEAGSPALAQRVTNDVVSLFLEENLKGRQQSAQETTAFLDKEAGKLSDRISSLEAKLAVFKEEHGDSLPELKDLNLQLMQRAEDRLRDNEQSIRTLEERKTYLQSQLALVAPFGDTYSSDGRRVLGPKGRLKLLEADYAGVAAHYSENHPDRVRMEQEIASLRQQVGRTSTADLERKLRDRQSELANLRERYSDAHAEVKNLKNAVAITEKQLAQAKREGASGQPDFEDAEDADNPAYVQLRTQLNAVDAELASVKATREELQAKLVSFEDRLAAGPRIEREYLALTRDRDNAMATYQEITRKRTDAELGQAMESERKGERFSLIEPPRFPEKPAKPNRLAILFLGVVFAFGGGVGNLAMREAMDKSVRGERGLQSVIGVTPMVVVPYIDTQEDIDLRARKRMLLVGGLILGTAAAALAVHVFVMPLELLWLKVLQRVGII